VGAARRAGRQEANAYASLSRQMSDAVQGIKAIKAMALERRVAPLLEREMGEINSALRRNAVASEALRSLQEPILVALMAIGLYALVVYAERPIESLIVMALLFQRSAGMIGQVQQAYQKTVAHEGFFVHMVERTRLAEDAAERNNGTRSPTLDQGLEFRNVSFSYGSHPALDTISTRLESGKIYALVGPSGSGKTTFVDLVLGFHRATSGQVLIDGVPIEEIDIGKWRSLVGYVPQELFLFHDTIRKNITLGANVTDEDVDRCIDAARARTFIETLPNGLETVVGERGSKLSGGQRQRIAIARALLHAPRLLVLDEPTTALDPETEAGVSATLENLKGQVTVLLISHQAALSRIADHVLELRQGRLSATRSRDTAPRSNVDGRPGSGP
jgi:ATP-binding cassette subfamily C protein